MPASAQKLFDVLQKLDLVPLDSLKDLHEQAQENEELFIELLLQHTNLTDEQIGQIAADEDQLPFVDLAQLKIPREVLSLLPRRQAEKLDLIVFSRTEDELSLAVHEQNEKVKIIKIHLSKKTGLPVKFYFATRRGMLAALSQYGEDLEQALAKIIAEAQGDWPAAEVVDLIFKQAVEQGASDIHIESAQESIRIRYRKDGVMSIVADLPKEYLANLLMRIKVLAKLQIDEHQAAQDGLLSIENEAEKIDARVSVVPTAHGESVVIRLLDTRQRRLAIDELGLTEQHVAILKKAYLAPHGMFLVTGPTGSGKTTTLYSILSELNDPKSNIMTIEDPIEYSLANVNQIQVNMETNLTFADGLRSIVRQDPDIILVVRYGIVKRRVLRLMLP